MTFTDAVASYFVFQLLIIGLFIPLFKDISSFLSVLAAASILTVPIIGYSLYYQAVKANTWCRLCVIIDIILVLQVVIFAITYVEQMFFFTSAGILSIAISSMLLVSITSSVLLVKIQLKTVNSSRMTEIVANRVKYDPKVFEYLLLNQDKVDTSPFDKEICIGDTKAPIELIMGASFGCSGCKEGFKQALQVIKTYPERVYLRIRFLPIKAEDDFFTATKDGFIIGYWLQHIQGKENKDRKTEELIKDWYNINNVKKFRQKYSDGLNKNIVETAEKFAARCAEWYSKENISRTPIFLVNNYKLPKNYVVEDLIGLIPGIVNFFKRHETNAKQKAEKFA